MKKTYKLVCKTIDSVEKYGMTMGLRRCAEGPTCLLGHIQRSLNIPDSDWGVRSVMSDRPEAVKLEQELEKALKGDIANWNDLNAFTASYIGFDIGFDLEGLKAKALKVLRKIKRKVR